MKKTIKIVAIIITLILLMTLIEIIYYKITFKKDHQLLFSILSDGGFECNYVKLDIYDDNTYAFYNEMVYREDSIGGYIGYEDNPTIGTYKYDATKLLNAVKSGNQNDANSKYAYIIEDNEENRYYVGSNNKELKKLLNSMFLQKIRFNLNTCPKYR